MSSGQIVNPVTDYLGQVPGAMANTIGNRPLTGFLVGDWYLATDIKKLYRWDGVAWIEMLNDDGGGGNGNFDQLVNNPITVITIPHGLVSYGGGNLTPTYAGITAKNSITATVLSQGYYLTYDPINIYVHLLVTTAPAPAYHIVIDWNAIT